MARKTAGYNDVFDSLLVGIVIVIVRRADRVLRTLAEGQPGC
jgi:hypothetical protein